MPDIIHSAIYKLLPSGTAWPPETEDTKLKGLMYGIGDCMQDMRDTIIATMDAYYPGQSGIFLEDWEKLLGLPKCGELGQTIQDRVNQVLAMLQISPYSNEDFYVDIAAIFGYTITVGAFDSANPFKISISTGTGTQVYFSTDNSVAGDPLLLDTVNTTLKCILEFFKPAHAYLDFT